MRIVLIALAVSLAGILSAHGQNRPGCLSYQNMEDFLAEAGEIRRGVGIGFNGNHIVELWSSDDGSWTVVTVRANLTSCATRFGTDWRWTAVRKGQEL